jgi:putative glutathione S-transferase
MSKTGEFKRDTTYLDGRITADGRDGWPLEPGRYRLVVARGCPWANRSMIVRRLLGLEDALSMGICGPTHDWRSWTFDLDPGEQDPVLGIHWLREAYEKAVPGYERGVTVPAIVDIPSGKVVTSEFRRIPLDLESEWAAYHRAGAPDLYPDALRDERLTTRRYLVGDTITEADVRLWPTLARFDAVYHGHFKCNRNKLTEMPVLWAYARDLFQTPGFGDTIDFTATKQHYYLVHKNLNPSGIVPDGPDLSGWLTKHHREDLGGRPFGDGTPPGPVQEAERVPASHTAH